MTDQQPTTASEDSGIRINQEVHLHIERRLRNFRIAAAGKAIEIAQAEGKGSGEVTADHIHSAFKLMTASSPALNEAFFPPEETKDTEQKRVLELMMPWQQHPYVYLAGHVDYLKYTIAEAVQGIAQQEGKEMTPDHVDAALRALIRTPAHKIIPALFPNERLQRAATA